MRLKTLIGLLPFALVWFCPIVAIGQDTTITKDSLKVVLAVKDRASTFDTRLDSATIQLNSTIDSLKNIDQPASRYADRLDSVYRSFQMNVLTLLPGMEKMDVD